MFTLTFEQFFIALGGITVLTGIVQAFYPMWTDRRNRKYLQQISRYGLFDKATIQSATRGYIRPKCQNLDPAQEQELRHALVATREDLFRKVDYFLDHENEKRHLFVLAESGIGKTSFVLNYYIHNSRRGIHKHPIIPIPLGHNRSDEMIDQIKKMNNSENIILFLDALDEDIRAIENYRSRIQELMSITSGFKKIVITCRTQFFPKDEEIPSSTGIMRFGSRRAGDNGFYEFWKIYLSPFDDEDIDSYIKKHYSFWKYWNNTVALRKKAVSIAKHVPMLSVRPMLLAHIPDLVNHNIGVDQSNTLSIAQLYEIMVNAWIEREMAWIDKSSLREFSERLAVEMVANRSERGMERIPYDDLNKVAKNWNIKMQQWQISGRSLLNRDSDGNYKFAHRSIMEYLFIERYIKGDSNCYDVKLTDQMLKFLFTKTGHHPRLREIENIVFDFFSNANTLSKAEITESLDNAIQNVISASTRVFGAECQGFVILYRSYQNENHIKFYGRIFESALISDINNSIGSVLNQNNKKLAYSRDIEGSIHKARISFNVRKPLIEGKCFVYEDASKTKNIMLSSPICLSEESKPNDRQGVVIIEQIKDKDKDTDNKKSILLINEVCRRLAAMLMFTDRYTTKP